MRINDTNYITLLKKKKESALYFVVDKYHPLVKWITLKILSSLNKEELIECINNLGQPDSNIFIMKYFLGYNSQEIADKLSLTKASVDNRLSRGKKNLKCKLSNIKEAI